MRLATAKMSDRLCEMKMTATAFDFRPSINALTLRCSGTPSAAVGTSMIRMSAFQKMARPMATAWR